MGHFSFKHPRLDTSGGIPMNRGEATHCVKRKHRVWLLLLFVTLEGLRASSGQSNSAKKLPHIVILATGGTIAGAAASGPRPPIPPER